MASPSGAISHYFLAAQPCVGVWQPQVWATSLCWLTAAIVSNRIFGWVAADHRWQAHVELGSWFHQPCSPVNADTIEWLSEALALSCIPRPVTTRRRLQERKQSMQKALTVSGVVPHYGMKSIFLSPTSIIVLLDQKCWKTIFGRLE